MNKEILPLQIIKQMKALMYFNVDLALKLKATLNGQP